METIAMEQEEFCKRFVDRMLQIAVGKVGDMTRREVENYAEEVAPTYFENPDQREDGPEICAESDFSCWD